MSHRTKVIEFLGKRKTIFLQNGNGPCPLLAICNALTLQNHLRCKPTVTEVSQEDMIAQIADRIIVWNSNSSDEEDDENQERNIADVLELIPKLTTGIDVNVKFRRITDFEFTPECALFDLLDIGLYHGWIPDRWDSETVKAIGSRSYNDLSKEIVSLETERSVEDEMRISTEELVMIRSFMERSANQLTEYGLISLREDIDEGEVCVFFRNNHFSTMFKYRDELYVLATDQGYEDQPDLVWERLDGVNGDTTFMTGKFEEFKYVADADDAQSRPYQQQQLQDSVRLNEPQRQHNVGPYQRRGRHNLGSFSSDQEDRSRDHEGPSRNPVSFGWLFKDHISGGDDIIWDHFLPIKKIGHGITRDHHETL